MLLLQAHTLGTWRTSPTEGCHGANAWTTNHMRSHYLCPLLPSSVENCIPTLHNFIIWIYRRWKQHAQVKMVSSSYPNFKVKINPTQNIIWNNTIYTYIPGTQMEPLFWRIQPPKQRTKRYITVYQAKRVTYHWIHPPLLQPGGVGPLKTVGSLGSFERTRLPPQAHLDKDSERTFKVQAF